MPQTAASAGEGLFPFKNLFDICAFNPSYKGNCIDVNGIYRSAPNPVFVRVERAAYLSCYCYPETSIETS